MKIKDFCLDFSHFRKLKNASDQHRHKGLNSF